MGMLKGWDPADNKTGLLYGKYSFGNIYSQMLDATDLEERFIPIVRKDVMRSGVLRGLPEMDVMDVGTGRQSIALASLGARSVAHYDISEEHVARFGALLLDRYADLPIVSRRIDLCREPLPAEAYDYIYLNGIAHHFSHVADGLRNCASACRMNGRMWVYFYRSGTFQWFVNSMIRAVADAADIDKAFACSAMIYAHGDPANFQTLTIMDNFYVPYIHLYSPFQYIEFMRRLGFRICGSNDLDPLTEVNHDCLHHSATIVFERHEEIDVRTADTGRLLTPEDEVNQLDPAMYDDDQPKQCIELFERFKAMAEGGDRMVVWSTLLGMHRAAADQYYGGTELPPKYEQLKRVISAALDIL